MDRDELVDYIVNLKEGDDVNLQDTEINNTVLERLRDKDVQFGAVSFKHARFVSVGQALWMPILCETLDLTAATFTHYVELDVVAGTVCCDGARFEDGVTMRAWGAAITAQQVFFGAPSSIVSASSHTTTGWAALRSLRGTDVSNLVLTDIDLTACRFAGTHRLDQLRVEGRSWFDQPPGRLRWTSRQVLAEEAVYRGWRLGEPGYPEHVAPLYRALRKSLEDSKNEASAGDFYYGEMEMRRHSPTTRWAERVILWFYWLLSGYGQRAGRAIVALLVVVATVAALLTAWGRTFGDAALIATGAVVFRDDNTDLTAAGEWTVLAARFLGPILLALAVLAIRARVKR